MPGRRIRMQSSFPSSSRRVETKGLWGETIGAQAKVAANQPPRHTGCLGKVICWPSGTEPNISNHVAGCLFRGGTVFEIIERCFIGAIAVNRHRELNHEAA